MEGAGTPQAGLLGDALGVAAWLGFWLIFVAALRGTRASALLTCAP